MFTPYSLQTQEEEKKVVEVANKVEKTSKAEDSQYKQENKADRLVHLLEETLEELKHS